MKDYIEAFCSGKKGADVLIEKNFTPWQCDTKFYPYLERVIVHKNEVYEAGISLAQDVGLGVDDYYSFKRRLILHDLSKFSEVELYGYGNYNFNGENTPAATDAFHLAWHHHKWANDHHPEHWLSTGRDGFAKAIEMPKLAMYEMVADWIGAGKTYGSSLGEWLPKNLHTFLFHENTMNMLGVLLRGLGFDVEQEKGRLVCLRKI